MSPILSAFALALLATAPPETPLSSPPTPTLAWGRMSEPDSEYVSERTGNALSPEGAAVTIRSRSAAPQGYGGVGASAPAEPLRRCVVTVSAELQTRGVTGGAVLFLRIEGDGANLELENGRKNALSGDSEWTRRSVSFYVPSRSTRIYFGVVLNGGGVVSARGLRFESGDPSPENRRSSVPPAAVLEAAFDIVRMNALRRDAVDWNRVEPEIRALARGAEEPPDVYPAIRRLLSKLGDGHSFLVPPAASSSIKSGGAENPPVEVRSLPGGVGLVRLLGYTGTDPAAGQAFARKAHDAIGAVRKDARCGWVVDLRSDTGGNMWPMLAALEPFLGDGPVGSFEGGVTPAPPWSAKGGLDARPPASLDGLLTAWVAVLAGPHIASSGEAVAIAFRERPRTRSFGEPTAGVSTANSPFELPDGGAILLTVSVMADRTGRQYGGKIEPDVRIDAAPGTKEGFTLSSAVSWLTQASGCGESR